MKNVTFSADGSLIEAARERARSEHTTLNAEFRRWLESYARREERGVAERLVERALSGGSGVISCVRLWSEDFQHGRSIDGVQIMNPFA